MTMTYKKRIFYYIIGLNLLACGIIFNTRSGLGVAAFASVYYALMRITHLTLGMASIAVYAVLILVQLMITKKMTLAIALQIPFSFLFGFITDFYNAVIPFQAHSVFASVMLLTLGLLFSSFGVYLYAGSQIVNTPVEGTITTISTHFHLRFSLVKNFFDLTMFLVTIIMCLILRVPFYGIGIGTVICALLQGRIIALCEDKLDLFHITPATHYNEKKEVSA